MVLVDTSDVENIKNKRVGNGLYFIEKIKDIKSKELKKIERVEAIGVTLYKVIFEDMVSANSFVQNEEIKEKKMRVFIPKNFVETFGVIRNVPVSFSEEELLTGIVSERKVASVRRFVRKAEDGAEPKPTETVKVGFYGDDHPSWIVFNHTVLVVDTYYPAIRQCYNCGRLGHTKMGCRSNTRCLKCGECGCDGKCNERKCILCDGKDHTCRDSKKCPKWEKEMETNKIMTRKKLSKKEVYDMYNRQKRCDIVWDDNNFPSLPAGKKDSGGVNQKANEKTIDDDVNLMVTPYTYRSIAKKPKKAYVHRPGVQMQCRMFGETVPEGPVFPREDQKTTELEKVTRELLKFITDFFKKSENQVAMDAMNHFHRRIERCGVMLEEAEVGEGDNSHDGVNKDFSI
ncbi:uncharacterized protein [Musca autumnalis]|uniref:uncharacterized protein n=1 Tax=Musca autumnalis TaxID=221902 RepID=UPI003CF70E06